MRIKIIMTQWVLQFRFESAHLNLNVDNFLLAQNKS